MDSSGYVGACRRNSLPLRCRRCPLPLLKLSCEYCLCRVISAAVRSFVPPLPVVRSSRCLLSRTAPRCFRAQTSRERNGFARRVHRRRQRAGPNNAGAAISRGAWSRATWIVRISAPRRGWRDLPDHGTTALSVMPRIPTARASAWKRRACRAPALKRRARGPVATASGLLFVSTAGDRTCPRPRRRDRQGAVGA